ncbi:MAG TPA: zinc-binding alcohol dehydrogenase family protein [Polyangiaceae bacterium]|nr:zinc-binding alcohol dehydrogenase family protein [Polyangiaceae bacterium]
MKAWRLHEPGGPDAFVLEEMPMPEPAAGQVLIEVRAFGLNRSEWFTRIGESPTVKLPRVLGIECVGTVVQDPSGELAARQRVAAMMGGMGREFDGSYAEYTCVPAASVFALETELAWEVLGALPEMLQTCHGSLHTGLEVQAGETLLIRGGTSSIGLTTLAMAKHARLQVISTSRSDAKVDVLKAAGADEVVIDSGTVAERVRALHPQGVDRVLELIGTTTLLDSLQCARPGGVVCMTGILGGQWELASFRPMGQIPTAVRLTSYSGGAGDISREQLRKYVSMVESGQLEIQRGPMWRFDQLPLAHQAMDENRANGKMVVVVR